MDYLTLLRSCQEEAQRCQYNMKQNANDGWWYDMWKRQYDLTMQQVCHLEKLIVNASKKEEERLARVKATTKKELEEEIIIIHPDWWKQPEYQIVDKDDLIVSTSIPTTCQEEECVEEACGVDIFEAECVPDKTLEGEGIQDDDEHGLKDASRVEVVEIPSREDVVQPRVRKFETFETLFDPPKFLPGFMTRDVVDNFEDKGHLACVDTKVVETTIFAKDGGDSMFFDIMNSTFRSREVYEFGSLWFFTFDLNKIRGRIFLKKGRMHYEWVHVILLLCGYMLGSIMGYEVGKAKNSILLRRLGMLDQRDFGNMYKA